MRTVTGRESTGPALLTDRVSGASWPTVAVGGKAAASDSVRPLPVGVGFAVGDDRAALAQQFDADAVAARLRRRLRQHRRGDAGAARGDHGLDGLRRQEQGRRPVEDAVAHGVTRRRLAVAAAEDGGAEELLGAGPAGRRRRRRPVGVGPVLRHDHAVGVGGADLRGGGGDVRLALLGRGDDAPALAAADREIGGGAAAADHVLEVLGETDGGMVVDLAAVFQQPAALIDGDDGAGAVERPFDAPAGQRPARRVHHRGDQHLFRVGRQHRVGGPHVQARGPRIDGGEETGSGRLGLGVRDGSGGRRPDQRVRPARGTDAPGQTGQ